MKKFFDNFYIFSKFALSISLLVCLFAVLYILFINYQKEEKFSENQTNFEEELNNNINKNSNLINKISNEIKNNETALNQIKKNVDSILEQNKNENFSNITKSIQLLNDNFTFLAEEIKNLKVNNSVSLQENDQNNSKLLNRSKNEIIDLILIKYENNKVFDRELEYLRNIINESKITNLEKISVLSTQPFKGHEYLKSLFDDEVNIYLKKIITNNPDSLFSKIILPYLEISPTSENIVTNDLILKIKEIKLYISNRDIESALKNLKTIENYDNNFQFSYLEIEKYINFKNELFRLR